MKNCISLLLLLLLVCSVKAQNEWVNWNSASGGLTFITDTGKIFSSVPKNLAWPDYTGQRAYSYSDPATGNILFLTDGKNIWNKDYRSVLYPAGDTLIACDSDYYKVQIVPFADNPSRFYIFHQYSVKGIASLLETNELQGCGDENLSALYYSVLEMDFSNGTGKLISSNNAILKKPLDRVGLVRHANKKDSWVIAHSWNPAYYAAFLATDSGVHKPVISVIGPQEIETTNNIEGSIAASPDGKTIASSSAATSVEIYDFDNGTGTLSNYRTVGFPFEHVTSLSFSPDNTKLYIAVSDNKTCDHYSKIYQIDLNEPDLKKSVFLLKTYPRRRLDLCKAKDNRIWIKGAIYPETPGNFFDVIEYPNQPKNACTIKDKHLQYGTAIHLPNIINDWVQQPAEQAITKLNLPDTLRICFGKTTINAGGGYETYRWNTGDSAATVEVSRPGLYTVLAGKKGFSKPEAYGFVYVKSAAAEAFIAEDTLFCPKTPHELKVPENFTGIVWMDGDTRNIKPVPGPDEYKLTAIDANGCMVWDSICVSVHHNPQVQFGNDTTLCPGNMLPLHLQAYHDSSNLQSVKRGSFIWQNNSVKDTFTITAPGTYWGRISFDGCTVSDTINVQYITLPPVNLGEDTALCNGNSLRLHIPFSSTASYLWSTGSRDTAVTSTASSHYWVRVTNQFCVNTDSIDVKFKPLPVVSLGNDTVICQGSSLLLNLSPVNRYLYSWQNGDTVQQVFVSTAGQYAVTANLNGCLDFDTVNIGTMQAPVINLQDTFFCKQQKLILNPGTAIGDAVKWQDGSVNRFYTVSTPGNYSVTANNKCGSSFRTVAINEKLCQIIMPSAFTPNRDNRNDIFRVKYPEIVKELHFIIYNRWGQKVFETKDAYKGWDGTQNSGPAGAGTYVWRMNYTDADNNKYAQNGYVVLMR